MKHASLLLASLFTSSALAAAPEAIVFHGTLNDGPQAAADGRYVVKYGLHDTPNGLTPLTSVAAHYVDVAGGHFSDDISALFTASLTDAYLEISVQLPDMSFDVLPRTRLSAVPYSLMAARADTAAHVDWAGITNAPPVPKMYFAGVTEGKTLKAGAQGVVGVVEGVNAGAFEMTFAQDMTVCSCITAVDASSDGRARVALAYPSATKVTVFTNDSQNNIVAVPYYIQCLCP